MLTLIKNPTYITLVASGFGFFTSFLASVSFSPSAFGWVTVAVTQVSFWSAVFSFGFAGYFLGNISAYQKNIIFVFFAPILTSILVAIVVVSAVINVSFDIKNLSVLMLFICSLLAGSHALHSQIEKKPIYLALFQAVPTLVKSAAIFSVFFTLTWLSKDNNQVNIIGLCLLTSSIVGLIFLAIKTTFIPGLFKYALWKPTFILDPNFYGSWLSVVSSFAFATGIPGLVAWKTSSFNSAYFGVYIIFWSIASTLNVALISNTYMYQIAHAVAKKEFLKLSELYARAGRIAIIIGSVMALLTMTIALLAAEKIWKNFADIKIFLLFCAAILLVKSIQSSAGMILGLPIYIWRKNLIQFCAFLCFIGLLLFSIRPTAVDLVLYLLISEILLTLLFYIYAKMCLVKITLNIETL